MSETSAAQVSAAGAARPAVIADDLHVKYRVFATGRRNKSGRVIKPGPGTAIVHALRGVSFVVNEGESVGIIGHNGSGKSTLMKAIAGLVPASQGAVYASDEPSLLGVGAALMGQLSGEKNITLGTLALGLTPAESKQVFPEVARLSGIEEFLGYPMRTYSSGMTARLKFAIAMAKTHSILLIDEALAVGDKSFKQRSEERIRQLKAEAGTVFLVSHSMRSVLDTCERVIWIDHGLVHMDGPAAEVVAAYRDSTREL
ncbi:MAG: ABC transporter ATP-binding protein [Microbacterium sp.]|nr:ABC transporter ATP-binding protein [Microbacterium sp.]